MPAGSAGETERHLAAGAEMSATKEETVFPTESHWNLGDTEAYRRWRAERLAAAEALAESPAPVEIRTLANPSDSERRELCRRCRLTNAALYQAADMAADDEAVRDQLLGFARAMGLRIAERHRSAGRGGIVALRVSEAAGQRGYIPYSRRPMNWHTDGYYNPPGQKIRAMVLHCVRPADDGGENRFLDPEIAYIRLRDRNPDYIRALMHPAAMTIPENREPDGRLRPASIGPVFSFDPAGGALEMRYTARSRSIAWRDDPLTREAVAALAEILGAGDPLVMRVKMAAGQGILCNNSLHDRSGFDQGRAGGGSRRLVYRIRFHNRIPGS